jgi:predicted AlkP superfamily phosphohydrolase/phosphomutase
VGIDGFSPIYMDRFITTGKLPAIAGVVKEGVRAALVSTLPATTPVAWASISTGAPPSITGIEGFLIHRPGDRLDQRVSGCYSYRCRAQPIWETVTLCGKRSYVVKFPLSYPSQTASFRRDGAAGWGGLKCFHEIASSSVASVEPLNKQVLIERSEAGADQAGCLFHGVWRMKTLWGGSDVVLRVTVTEREGNQLVVEIADESGLALVSLREGEWSQPIQIRARGRQGVVECCFRIKLIECSQDPLKLRLLNTTLHERTGHSSRDDIWEKHLDHVGPIEEQTEPSLVFNAGLDLQSQLELFQLNAEWLQRISSQLISREPWDLMMVHIHIVDWAHHLLQGAIDSRHPAYDPKTAPRYEQALLETYQMADQLVATVRREAGPDTNIVIVGDHGQDLQHTTFRINEWLAAEGFLKWQDHESEVNWSATSAYGTGNYIYINQQGREPNGIVPAADVNQIKKTLISKLLALKDHATKRRPVLVAGNKEEFQQLGANGTGVGDVVFCLRSGYQATNNRGEIFSPTIPLREFTSGHDHFWPLDRRIHTRFFAAGPGFKRGYVHSNIEHVTDVAPTVCAVLGIESPADCRGHVIQQLLNEKVVRGALDLTPSTAIAPVL